MFLCYNSVAVWFCFWYQPSDWYFCTQSNDWLGSLSTNWRVERDVSHTINNFLLDQESYISSKFVVFVVCSLERIYNISINTGNNTLCLLKDDDEFVMCMWYFCHNIQHIVRSIAGVCQLNTFCTSWVMPYFTNDNSPSTYHCHLLVLSVLLS